VNLAEIGYVEASQSYKIASKGKPFQYHKKGEGGDKDRTLNYIRHNNPQDYPWKSPKKSRTGKMV